MLDELSELFFDVFQHFNLLLVVVVELADRLVYLINLLFDLHLLTVESELLFLSIVF